ncbi:hypothetical protein Tco_0214314 [Tanacetum coccineum]
MMTLAGKSLLSGGDKKPPMLEKHLYDSWKSRMELYMMNRPHGRMILASVEKRPLVWPSITEDGVTRLKEYVELTPAEAIQVDCDIKAINIILQGLPTEIYALVSQHRMAKDLWEKIKLLMQGTSLTKQEHRFDLWPISQEMVSALTEELAFWIETSVPALGPNLILPYRHSEVAAVAPRSIGMNPMPQLSTEGKWVRDLPPVSNNSIKFQPDIVRLTVTPSAIVSDRIHVSRMFMDKVYRKLVAKQALRSAVASKAFIGEAQDTVRRVSSTDIAKSVRDVEILDRLVVAFPIVGVTPPQLSQ